MVTVRLMVRRGRQKESVSFTRSKETARSEGSGVSPPHEAHETKSRTESEETLHIPALSRARRMTASISGRCRSKVSSTTFRVGI